MKTILVPNSASPGYSAILRNAKAPDGHLLNTHGNINTLYELFLRAVRLNPDQPFVGCRGFDPITRRFGDYQWQTATEALQLVEEMGSGLALLYQTHAIVSSERQLPLGIYSINRPEWLLTEYAGYRSNKYTVALYDTLGADSIEYIMNHAEVPVIVCSIDKIPKLLKLSPQMPHLKCIISMDAFDKHGDNPCSLPFTVNSIQVLREWSHARNIALYDIQQVAEMGRSNPQSPCLPKPDDLCTICYTSGTTGEPKGVVSTHHSYTFSARASYESVPISNGIYLSFLPLAHCYERLVIYTGMVGGGRIGFYSGDILNIAEDAQALKPTVMIGVPRLFNRIYDKIAAATIYAPGLTGLIARTALNQKLDRLDRGLGTKHVVWDRLVCRKIQQFFGGQLQLMVSGSAPIDGKVLNFLRVALATTVVEGYGSTECNALATVTTLDEYRANNVGIPYPGVEIRLRDVPEMNYLTTDKPCPRGEVLVKGPHVFRGYYKQPEMTKEALDKDGWLITGDVGQFETDGNLKIIDRRKNIFKLAQGEYVAVEYLETVYGRLPMVQNIFVYGDSLQSSLVAVVVPEPEAFVPWATRILGKQRPLEELCGDSEVVGALLVELRRHGREAQLQGFEILEKIHCDPVPFDIEGNGLLTTTFKLKRSVAKEYYKKEIELMYK